MIKKILAVLLLFPFLAFGQEDSVIKKTPEANWEHISRTGASLLRHFWEDRSTGNAAHASRYMDANFQSVYYFGALDKSGELNIIQTLNMTSYSLSRTVETRQGSFLIVTYLANVDEMLNGQHIIQQVPCTTTWKQEKDHWKLMSHTELSEFIPYG